MVNGRTLEDELKRIDEFFAALSVEELERIAFECGIGEIEPSYKSKYVQATNQKYRNEECSKDTNSEGVVFSVTTKEGEAA